MENILLLLSAIIVSLFAAYGYYLTLIEKDEKFKKKKESKTRYRTNEEFVNY